MELRVWNQQSTLVLQGTYLKAKFSVKKSVLEENPGDVKNCRDQSDPERLIKPLEAIVLQVPNHPPQHRYSQVQRGDNLQCSLETLRLETPFRCPAQNFNLQITGKKGDVSLPEVAVPESHLPNMKNRNPGHLGTSDLSPLMHHRQKLLGVQKRRSRLCRSDDVSVKERERCVEENIHKVHQRLCEQMMHLPGMEQKPSTPGLYGLAVEKYTRKCPNRTVSSHGPSSPASEDETAEGSTSNVAVEPKSLTKSLSLPSIQKCVSKNLTADPPKPKDRAAPGELPRFPEIKEKLPLKDCSSPKSGSEVPSEAESVGGTAVYNYAGFTSSSSDPKTLTLSRLTGHHYKKLLESKTSLSSRGFQIWADKIRDVESIVDNASYDLYARKPVPRYSLSKVIATMVTMNQEERLKAMLEQTAGAKAASCHQVDTTDVPKDNSDGFSVNDDSDYEFDDAPGAHYRSNSLDSL